MARDAEGATKLVTVTVTGAASIEEAKTCARRICNNQLVKCSWHGGDPYWGRILSAAGSAGVAIDVAKAAVSYGGVVVSVGGMDADHDHKAVKAHMKQADIEVAIDLAAGDALGADVHRRPRPGIHPGEQRDLMTDLALQPETSAHVIVRALPYIRRFAGKVVVVKLGGAAMTDPDLNRTFAEDILLLRSVGVLPVVVHGGGPQIGALMERLGKTPEFRQGQRVTDAETLDIARMVLVGKINRDIVAAINRTDGLAVGLSGEDAGLITASARDPELGFVGDVASVDPKIVVKLLNEGLIPVISTIGSSLTGQAYNINADAAAPPSPPRSTPKRSST